MPERPPPRRAVATSTVVFGGVWMSALTAMQWSVARFRVLIVVVLTAAAVALWVWLVRRAPVRLTPLLIAVMGVGTAVVTLTVPVFTYATEPARSWILAWHAGSVLLIGGFLFLAGRPRWAVRRGWRQAPIVALGAVAISHCAIVWWAIRSSPAPRIDVWVVLQQAADAIGRGENIYGREWVDSPGVGDAFTYLPWTAVLLAPGRWFAGDIRWAMLAWVLLGMVGIGMLGGPRARWAAAAGAMLIYLPPGVLTQVDQAWTEPLLLTLLIWWAVLIRRGHPWWAVLPLALACASKQHIALILPVLVLWRGFGPARTLMTGGLAGLLVLPWFLAGPAAFVHDTIVLLVDFHPIRFSNTLYLFALNVLEVSPPFWITGLVVGVGLGAAMWLVQRPGVDLAWVVRICAAALLTASLVNKQAFYNQFWLVSALVVLSLVIEAETLVRRGVPAQASRPARGGADLSRAS